MLKDCYYCFVFTLDICYHHCIFVANNNHHRVFESRLITERSWSSWCNDQIDFCATFDCL